MAKSIAGWDIAGVLFPFAGGGLVHHSYLDTGERFRGFCVGSKGATERTTGRKSNWLCPCERGRRMKLARRAFLKAGASSVALLAATGCDQLPREMRLLLALNAQESGPFKPPLQGA